MFLRHLQNAHGPVLHRLQLSPPQVKKARMEQGIGQRERMPQIDSKGDGTGRALRGTIGKPEHPENERRNCKARDPWMATKPESAGPKARRLKAGHGLLQMLQAPMKITLQGDARAQHEMAVDSHARIVLSLGQEKDLAPDLCSLLKLGPIV